MTDLQKMRARALAQATIAKHTASYSFVKAMAHHAEHQPDRELTPRQAEFLTRLSWTFRRQIPAALVPAQNPYPQTEEESTADV
jgi:hypothetical protein